MLLFGHWLLSLDVSLANVTDDVIVAPVTGCGCTRLIQVSSGGSAGKVNVSTCSPEAYRRGSGQKVVAYAFYEPPTKKTLQSREVYFQVGRVVVTSWVCVWQSRRKFYFFVAFIFPRSHEKV